LVEGGEFVGNECVVKRDNENESDKYTETEREKLLGRKEGRKEGKDGWMDGLTSA